MNNLRMIEPYALGASFTVLADRIIDVGIFDWTALLVIVLVMGGALGRRLYA
jgi:hypothetical protein